MISCNAYRAAVLTALLLAVRAVSAPVHPRILQANLADWDAVLLRVEEPFFVSEFRPVQGLAAARMEVAGYLAPTYERRGDDPGRIHSGAGGVEGWFAPDSRWAMGLGGRRDAWSESHADGNAWSFRASEDLGTLPLSLCYRGMAGKGRPAFSVLAKLLDGEKGSWLAALSASDTAGAGPRWEAELRLRRESHRESWSMEATDPDSAARFWKADYRATIWGIGVHAGREFGFGTLAAKGEYALSRPGSGRAEYRLGDSSQLLLAGLSLRLRPVFAGGRWNLRSEYAESQSFTEGLRRSPGGSEHIRFHHALGQALSVHSGAEWESPGAQGVVRLRAGVFHRYYRYRTSPHPDAYYERKETFSYNRLESSLLASLYGGFRQSAELVRADLRLRSAEFRPVLAADFGRFGADLSAPAAFHRLDAQVSGETMTRQLLTTDVERRYAWSARGPLVTAAPGLALRIRTGPAVLRARASHAFVLWNGVRSGEGGNEAVTGSGAAYPWMGNAALLEASATLDF